MSGLTSIWALRVKLGRLVAAASLGWMLAVVSAGSGLCQVPDYGYERDQDQWAPYESGRYFDHLQKIVTTYRFSGWKISYLHFEVNGIAIGAVDLFRISEGQGCREGSCYFVLFSSEMPNAPLITECQFKSGGYAHFFNPDGSNFWGFEFSCKETLLQVKVTSTHFFPISVRKTE